MRPAAAPATLRAGRSRTAPATAPDPCRKPTPRLSCTPARPRPSIWTLRARTGFDDDEHVQYPEGGRDCDEEIARENRRRMIRNVDQRRSPRGCPRGRFGRYLLTVRGETPTPNLSNNSLAIRSSPHKEFSLAILRSSARSSYGIGGRPGRDFSRQNNRQPARCQRTKVAGFTTTKAPR